MKHSLMINISGVKPGSVLQKLLNNCAVTSVYRQHKSVRLSLPASSIPADWLSSHFTTGKFPCLLRVEVSSHRTDRVAQFALLNYQLQEHYITKGNRRRHRGSKAFISKIHALCVSKKEQYHLKMMVSGSICQRRPVTGETMVGLPVQQ
ncbi:hypothetical protein KXW60_007776 [Aspergillus fumigatus]|nr:hypothetical protein KXX47_007181 [Aspergillus fumigatus]KAH3015709.1 hypothetical protein KXW60_007776 [Aspergillus fumigatus]